MAQGWLEPLQIVKPVQGSMMVNYTMVFILLMAVHEQSLGQTDTTKASSLSISGYLDVYYAYYFNNPSPRNGATLANSSTHIFSHSRHNEFALNNGIVFLKYQSEKTRAALSLHTGTYVQANYSNEPDILKNIYEAYAGFQLNKYWWIDAGIFSSHIGAETAISMDNYTLSRSMMADNTPYYESGVKLTYSKNEELSISLLLLNGWQNISENNDNKAFGSKIQFKPLKNLLLNSSTFIGKETPAFDSLSSMRYFHNFYSELKFKNFNLLAAFDFGIQKKRLNEDYDIWYNPNLIINFSLSPNMALALRAEYYHDKEGVIIDAGTPKGFQTFSSSLNFDIKVYENIMWRMEGKIFNSKYPVYRQDEKLVKHNAILLSSLSIKLI